MVYSFVLGTVNLAFSFQPEADSTSNRFGKRRDEVVYQRRNKEGIVTSRIFSFLPRIKLKKDKIRIINLTKNNLHITAFQAFSPRVEGAKVMAHRVVAVGRELVRVEYLE